MEERSRVFVGSPSPRSSPRSCLAGRGWSACCSPGRQVWGNCLVRRILCHSTNTTDRLDACPSRRWKPGFSSRRIFRVTLLRFAPCGNVGETLKKAEEGLAKSLMRRPPARRFGRRIPYGLNRSARRILDLFARAWWGIHPVGHCPTFSLRCLTGHPLNTRFAPKGIRSSPD